MGVVVVVACGLAVRAIGVGSGGSGDDGGRGGGAGDDGATHLVGWLYVGGC